MSVSKSILGLALAANFAKLETKMLNLWKRKNAWMEVDEMNKLQPQGLGLGLSV